MDRWQRFRWLDMQMACSTHRVACLKFGHPALSSEFYNYTLIKEFVAAVGIILIILNHHSKAEGISKQTVRSQIL